MKSSSSKHSFTPPPGLPPSHNKVSSHESPRQIEKPENGQQNRKADPAAPLSERSRRTKHKKTVNSKQSLHVPKVQDEEMAKVQDEEMAKLVPIPLKEEPLKQLKPQMDLRIEVKEGHSTTQPSSPVDYSVPLSIRGQVDLFSRSGTSW